MAASFQNRLPAFAATACLATACLATGAAAAAAENPAGANPGGLNLSSRAPITLDAQSAEGDGIKNDYVFHKVKISQGPMSVAADQAQETGQAGKVNFEDSHWVFRGNVKIVTDQGQLTSDEADVTFLKGVLAKAVITGKPAAFEQHLAQTGRPVRGHSEIIEYDVAKGTIQLSKNAWLSNGPDEIHGESLKYDILGKKMFADPSEQNSQRVHIVITPPPATPKP